MDFDLQLLLDSLPRLMAGAQLTLTLFVTSLLSGTVLAVLIVLMRLSRLAPLSWLAFGYTYFFRSTPVLVQIFVVYHGAPQFDFIRDSGLWHFFREPFFCVWFALTLNIAARVAEVMRGAITGVPSGVTEAGAALGLKPRQRFTYLTAPLAIRLGLPAYSNEMVSGIKATALASTVTLLDITGVARTIVAETFAPYEVFLSAALFYIAMTWLIQGVVQQIENHLNRNM